MTYAVPAAPDPSARSSWSPQANTRPKAVHLADPPAVLDWAIAGWVAASREPAEAARRLIADSSLPVEVRYGFARCRAERAIGYHERARRQLEAIDYAVHRGDYDRVLQGHPV